MQAPLLSSCYVAAFFPLCLPRQRAGVSPVRMSRKINRVGG